MHQESVRELIVVLLGGQGARDSLVAVLLLAALLNTEKWGEGGREARKPKQTEGSYLLRGKSAPEKTQRKEDTRDSSPL